MWPYSCCSEGCCFQNLFNVASSIIALSQYVFSANVWYIRPVLLIYWYARLILMWRSVDETLLTRYVKWDHMRFYSTLQINKYISISIYIYVCVCVCVCVCEYCYTQPDCFVLSQLFGVATPTSALSWDRNQADFHAVGYYPRVIAIFRLSEGISFYAYVICYLECSIQEKSYCSLAYVVAGKFPTGMLKPRGENNNL